MRHEGASFMAFLLTFLTEPSSFEGWIIQEGEIYPTGECMVRTICKKAESVPFWDGHAPCYKLWMEHNNYHDRIINALTTRITPGWRVLDIGAGRSILSLLRCAIGCDVPAMERSAGIRSLLCEDAFKRWIDWIKVSKVTENNVFKKRCLLFYREEISLSEQLVCEEDLCG